MPGVIGFVGDAHNGEPVAYLAAMARALQEERRHIVEMHAEAGFGLGRVTLGLLNPQPQPVWNAGRTRCIVMEGEVYDEDDWARRLPGPAPAGDAEYLLRLYEARGEDFARELNGAFAAAIWDGPARRLLVLNDRIGLVPVYYARRGNGLIFAGGARALLADPALSRQIDPLAMAQFLTFQHALGDRTFLADVRLLPGASMLIFQEGRLTLRRYRELRYAEHHTPRPEADYVEELLHLLRQAVRRQARGSLPAGVLLSGGLDSRVLVALLREAVTDKLFSFTWGVPGCDDARYAREVSRIAGAEHHFFELRPDYLLELADTCVRLTDGMGSVINLHALATLDAQTRYARVIYKGFMGDAMMGYGLTRQHWAACAPERLAQAHYAAHEERHLLAFGVSEHDALFTPDFRRQIGSGVWDSYRAALSECPAALLAQQRLHFDLRQRVPRMTLNGVEVVRHRAVARLPFCDNDLVEFTLRVPPGLLHDRYLIKKAFAQAFPRLARVPYTDTGLPMLPCARDVLIRLDQQMRWRLRAAGLTWVEEPKRRPYAAYNQWLRGALRPWVEEVLLGARLAQRGIFNPATVRRLVDEQMAGAKHAVKLGALLTIELWQRQFVD